jgi:hypothetical protein
VRPSGHIAPISLPQCPATIPTRGTTGVGVADGFGVGVGPAVGAEDARAASTVGVGVGLKEGVETAAAGSAATSTPVIPRIIATNAVTQQTMTTKRGAFNTVVGPFSYAENA